VVSPDGVPQAVSGKAADRGIIHSFMDIYVIIKITVAIIISISPFSSQTAVRTDAGGALGVGDAPVGDARASFGEFVADEGQDSVQRTIEVDSEMGGRNTELLKPGCESRITIVTGYNSVPEQTDDTPCIAADGSDVCELEARGDHSCAASLPFGAKISVPGLGTCTVRDRLAPRFAHRIDWHFGGRPEVKGAREWGRKELTVTICQEEERKVH